MKLIKPSFEIIEQQPLEMGMLKHIELCGRVCYKSEDKIKENTANIFVNGLIKSGHTSVLEHGTVYLYIKDKSYNVIPLYEKYKENKYSKVNLPRCNEYNAECYVTTNYRILVENNWLYDLQYQCEPTEFHEKRVTVKFICDRGISHEFVRHRVFSFSQENSRYCNYSKDKFGNEITFIEPCWDINTSKENYSSSNGKSSDNTFEWSLIQAEETYFKLLQEGWKPEQARNILPNSLKTELMMTGFISDWKHFFKLRTDKAAHPQSKELAIPLQQQFKKLNLI